MNLALPASVVAAFLLGLAGSLHCAGMCGPIAIALPIDSSNRLQDAGQAPGKARWLRQITGRLAVNKLLYQFGRVTTYSVLGAIIGVGGSAFRIAGYSRALSIASGILMILAITVQYVFRKDWGPMSVLTSIRKGSITPLQRTIARMMQRRGERAHFLLGLANGLLPCGLVTTALLGAIGSGSVLHSAAYMTAFGLGTVPLMSAIALGAAAIPCAWRHRLPLAAPIVGLALAALIIVRGMNLGIPYVSPSMHAQPIIASTRHTSPVARASATENCCAR